MLRALWLLDKRGTTSRQCGEQRQDHGKYVEVWKKQPDGSWKCVIDMYNSDVPASQ
jgi:ketosteroid isomerase-like protein